MAFKDKDKEKEYYKNWRASERGKAYLKDYSRKYYEKVRGTPEARRAFHMKQRFGLSMEDYARMLSSQEYVCAICKQKQVNTSSLRGTLAVDHDHNTGVIRGLLCHPCNIGLGSFKDSELLLNNAIKYINKSHEK